MSAHSNQFQNYFKDHYRYSFSQKDLDSHRQWFTAQWQLIQQEVLIAEYQSAPILEIGSASGGFAQFLQSAGCQDVTGLELDQAACRFAQKTFPKYSFRHQPIEQFKSRKKFQLVFAFEVLEHLSDPKAALAHIRSLMAEDGILIASSPFPFPKNIWGDTTHTYVLHPENWRKLLQEAGFSQVETTPMSFLPFLWRVHPSLNIRLPFYLSLPFCISTTLLIAKM